MAVIKLWDKRQNEINYIVSKSMYIRQDQFSGFWRLLFLLLYIHVICLCIGYKNLKSISFTMLRTSSYKRKIQVKKAFLKICQA